MKKTISAIALLCLIAAQGVHADEAAATRCAASLQPHARLVFDAVTARPQPEFTLRAVLEARVRELVFMDRLMKSAARPAAEAASDCLRIARSCAGETC
jgi:hypothetical protein